MAIERVFVGEGVKEVEVKNYLAKELKRAGIASIAIQRTPLVTRIVLHCDRPALVIGRKGKNVKQITQYIEQNFNIERPELEIKKVDNPNLEPNIVAYRIASALERGMNPRKVGYKALRAIIQDGAKGAEIIMSGKLIGKGGRARTLKMRAGYMKKCGQPSLEQVLHGLVIATCKPGVIGVEVSIVPQNTHFPDEVTIIKPEEVTIVEEMAEEIKGAEAPGEATPKEADTGKAEKKAKKPKAEEAGKGAKQVADKDAKPVTDKDAKPKAKKPVEKTEPKTGVTKGNEAKAVAVKEKEVKADEPAKTK